MLGWICYAWRDGRFGYGNWKGFFDNGHGFSDLFLLNITLLGLGGLVWQYFELRFKRLENPDTKIAYDLPPLAHLCQGLAFFGILIALGFRLWLDLLDWPILPHADLSITAWLATLALSIACLWNKNFPLALSRLYLLGIAGAALALSLLPEQSMTAQLQIVIASSLFVLLSATLFKYRERWLALLQDWGANLSSVALRHYQVTTYTGNFVLLGLTALCTYALLFGIWAPAQALSERLIAAVALMLASASFGLLKSQKSQLGPLRIMILGLLSGWLAFLWAWIEPGASDLILNRNALLLFAITSAWGLLHLLGQRLSNDLNLVSSETQRRLLLLALGNIAFVFVLEIGQQVTLDQVHIAPWAIALIALIQIGLSYAALRLALKPNLDPFRLAPEYPQAFVYLAEGLVLCLFAHIRLSMPQLFGGWFSAYWPFVILFLAVIGVGVSEILTRAQRDVLATPLRRTGVFLPLVPLLGLWLAPESSATGLNAVLFLAGLFYGAATLARRNFAYSAAMLLALNASLWLTLGEQSDFSFAQRPQLWLIPPALSVLIAVQLLGKKLTSAQRSPLRYTSVLIIYISSTAEIFLNGIGNSPHLCAILMVLSVAGIFMGMAARVRAYLFLGMSFLVLSLFTWLGYLWKGHNLDFIPWVTGFLLGIGILLAFGFIEKKRGQLEELMQKLSKWEN